MFKYRENQIKGGAFLYSLLLYRQNLGDKKQTAACKG